jgi:hypothetical protein
VAWDITLPDGLNFLTKHPTPPGDAAKWGWTIVPLRAAPVSPDGEREGELPAPRQEASGDGLREAAQPFAAAIAAFDEHPDRLDDDLQCDGVRLGERLTLRDWRRLRAALDAALDAAPPIAGQPPVPSDEPWSISDRMSASLAAPSAPPVSEEAR